MPKYSTKKKTLSGKMGTSRDVMPSSWYILLTYSMVQSPAWEANWFAASQEIPRIS